MTIHVLVEGPSERAFLERWAPRLLQAHPLKVHPHQGKGALPADLGARPDPKHRGLLDQLPAKLRGFAHSLDPAEDAVMVLVDADDDDPRALEVKIVAAASTCAPALPVTGRLAVEEMEAFYLGDSKALRKAFPHADMDMARDYEPDSICGTWELFGRIVHDGGGNKVAWAEAMGAVVTTKPQRSRSPSFRAVLTGLLDLVLPAPAPKPRRKYRHVSPGRGSSGKR